MSLVIKGAALLGERVADVLVQDGVIARIGSGLSGDDVLDGDGLVLLPGFVDLHTHLREPGREDAETIATGSAVSIRPGSMFMAGDPMKPATKRVAGRR